MILYTNGVDTSKVEFTHVSSHGIWILSVDKELFMPYEEFPWFKEQPLKAVLNVQSPAPGNF